MGGGGFSRVLAGNPVCQTPCNTMKCKMNSLNHQGLCRCLMKWRRVYRSSGGLKKKACEVKISRIRANTAQRPGDPVEPHLNYPPDADLRKLLRFEPDSGAIWLGERRMVLLHTAALSALRRDLITSVGTDHARRLLTRMGYASGLHDAGFSHNTPGDSSLEAMSRVGPQLHMLEGGAGVTPLHLKMDAAAGLFEGEFRWDDSWEAHAHRLAYGVVDEPACWILLGYANRYPPPPVAWGGVDEPACWILLGYASGYTSAFMGKLILFKEIRCGACGDEHCHIVGKPIDEWPDGAAYGQYFEDDSLLDKMDALSQQVQALKTTLEPTTSGGMLVGNSPAFQQAHNLMQRAAQTQVTVLLTGETGVGKERFARALHAHSDRAAGPFVAVNCAALPAELIEAELFGVEKGAYTGAHAARAGRFERAEGGTLFLDEGGDPPPAAPGQPRRALQGGGVGGRGGGGRGGGWGGRPGARSTCAWSPRPTWTWRKRWRRGGSGATCCTGSTCTPSASRRCASAGATSSRWGALCWRGGGRGGGGGGGRLRRALRSRLTVPPIRIPPLRERSGDIEPLARHLLARFMAVHNKRLSGLGDRALQALMRHDWPGNVRELENLVERGVILAAQGGTVELEHLFPNQPQERQDSVDPQGRLARVLPAEESELCERIVGSGLPLEQLEAQVLALAVERSGGNLSGAARLLGLTRPQLAYRLKRQQLDEETP